LNVLFHIITTVFQTPGYFGTERHWFVNNISMKKHTWIVLVGEYW